MKQVALICFVLALLSVSLADVPDKPVWPREFASPFGLNIVMPPTQNKSATLYYNWNVKAQRIDYYERCLPFISVNSYWHPCKLYFNPSGIYVSQPATGNDCCLMVPGVGSIPPAFLKPFNYSNVENAKDMWGVTHKCNHWTGPGGFAYWTDVQTDEDIQFQDGPTGVFWNFGKFDVSSQNPNLFNLPGTAEVCNKPCNNLALAQPTKDHIVGLYNTFNKMSHQQSMQFNVQN